MNSFNVSDTQLTATVQSGNRSTGTRRRIQVCRMSHAQANSRVDVKLRTAQVQLGWSSRQRDSRRRAGRLAIAHLAQLLLNRS